MEELLRKEYPFVNNIYLEEIFMKLEAQNIISVFRVSKTKKMIVLNKRNNVISDEIMKDSAYWFFCHCTHVSAKVISSSEGLNFLSRTSIKVG